MTRFNVTGMCCAEETALLRKVIGQKIGDPARLRFDLLKGEMLIEGELSNEDVGGVIQEVKGTGMTATVVSGDQSADYVPDAKHRSPFFYPTIFSGFFALLGVLLSLIPSVSDALVPYIAYGLAIVAGFRLVLPRAWVALRSFRPDMNLLMTLAVIGALAIDEWFEGAVISFLFALSLLLESWSLGRARHAIAALMESAPQHARRIVGEDSYEEVAPSIVMIGDLLLVKPGERFPVDGRVAKGGGGVDQASVTGESIPVEKSFGDQVYAGTVSLDGAMEIVATRPAADSTFARILRMVEDAGSRRSRSEQWVERFARIYTPLILLSALFVIVIPPLLFAGDWTEWLYRGLVILVIGCPCALVISTPVSIVAGLASAARHGVLIKGGEFLEIPAHLQMIAFDKTGTLTSGEPDVKRIVPLNGHDEHELLERAAALELNSTHPLARAILRHADHLGITPSRPDSFRRVEGKGTIAEINGRQYRLGSRSFLSDWEETTSDIEQQADILVREGASIVAIGSDRHVCGLIGITDTLRPETREAIEGLRKLGIESVMLTGDNKATAESIGSEAGLTTWYAELLPGDKLGLLESLVRDHGQVAMVGDGINDAPAMARSSIGIAMGVAGTDVALETADIALMSDDLSRLPWLVRHSRRTLSIIRWNVGIALGIKLIFFAATLLGYASLWGAIIADIGATLLVTTNALRLLRGKGD